MSGIKAQRSVQGWENSVHKKPPQKQFREVKNPEKILNILQIELSTEKAAEIKRVKAATRLIEGYIAEAKTQTDTEAKVDRTFKRTVRGSERNSGLPSKHDNSRGHRKYQDSI